MLTNDTLTSRILDTLFGALIFFVVVAGSTYYLQSSLIIFKHYDAYTHWAAVLIVVPLIAGLIMRLARLFYPLLSAIFGALAASSLLYPLYKSFWAEPPTVIDLLIYVAVVFGIGFIATQPLRTTFMIAFRLGRFAVPRFTTSNKKPVKKSSLTKTQRLQTSDSSNVIAMMELMVGVTSLALSIISIFFLGRS